MRIKKSLFVSACAWTLVVPETALASGISVQTFGGEHGTPMTEDPTAIFYNPSGIAGSHGGNAFADLTLAFRHATYDRPNSDANVPAGGEGANTGRASLLNLLASPFLGATYRFGDFAVGAAYYTPYGAQVSWDTNKAYKGSTQFPGAVDGVQRWYSITGVLRSSFVSLAAAYDFGALEVGLSGNLIQTVANTVRAEDPTGGNDLATEGRSWLDTSSIDFSMVLGVTYVPSSNVRIGFSYQSRPNFSGGIRASGHLRTLFPRGSENDNKVEFLTNLPDIFRVGASYRPREDVELRLFGDYQRWSALGDQCVVNPGANCPINANGSAGSANVILNQVRDWHDTFGVRGGASYWLAPEIELFAGMGYSSNAVPNDTLEAALPDFNAISAAIGGRFLVVKRLHFAATYTEFFYFSRDTTGESLHPTLSPPSESPDSGGKYTQQVGVLDLNANFAF